MKTFFIKLLNVFSFWIGSALTVMLLQQYYTTIRFISRTLGNLFGFLIGLFTYAYGIFKGEDFGKMAVNPFSLMKQDFADLVVKNYKDDMETIKAINDLRDRNNATKDKIKEFTEKLEILKTINTELQSELDELKKSKGNG